VKTRHWSTVTLAYVPIATVTGSWAQCMHVSPHRFSSRPVRIPFLRSSRDCARPKELPTQKSVNSRLYRAHQTLFTRLQHCLQDAFPLPAPTQRHQGRADECRTRGRMISIIVVSLRNFLRWCFFLLLVEQLQRAGCRSGSIRTAVLTAAALPRR